MDIIVDSPAGYIYRQTLSATHAKPLLLVEAPLVVVSCALYDRIYNNTGMYG